MAQSPLLSGIATAMRHLSERQRVIAGNIANADTPGFKTRTLAEPDFGALVGGGSSRTSVARPSVALTDGMAALGARAPQEGGRVLLDRDVSETKPDGNNVTLEDQLLKLGEVQADYATVTSLYRKQMQLLKVALGRGSP